MVLDNSPSSEKRELAHVDLNPKESHTPPSPEFSGEEHVMHQNIDEGFDPAFVRSTMRKVDFRLVPVLSLMYCISLIDRTNLGLARQANSLRMQKDLELYVGQRFSIATLVFFVPYIILEIPVSTPWNSGWERAPTACLSLGGATSGRGARPSLVDLVPRRQRAAAILVVA